MTDQYAKGSLPSRIIDFYLGGFRAMRLGRTLWMIVFIKLFILFAVFKSFFFPNYLKTNFTTERERADYVLEQITTTR